MKYGAVLLAIIIALPLVTVQLQGDASSPSVLYVGGSGTGNYTTIQGAINAANDGDTIYVYPGTYKENIVVSKGVNIVGTDATIDGGKVGDAVLITANHTSISGFRIENSSTTGAGIVIEACYVEIHECTIKNNFYGIYTGYCNISISHNNFLGNSHNAWDTGGNDWDDGTEGNYWDDYAGSDENMDGIGDSPYAIEGGISFDNHPLIYPYGKPVAIFMHTPNGFQMEFDGSISIDYSGIIENYTWNFGDGNISYGQKVNHTYASNGIYEVTLTVKDDNGKTGNSSKEVIVDTEAPSTTCSLIPPAPNGESEWYISGVWLDFNASDLLSGVNYTEYRVDSNDWEEYTGNASIKKDGSHYIQYYSVDRYGNSETVKHFSLKIDRTPPYTIAEPQENESTWYRTDTIVTLEGHDNTSGIYVVKYRINGGVFVQYNQEINITSEGIHTIEYFSKDIAGNAEKLKSMEVKIDKTAPSLDVKAPRKSYLYIMGREIMPLDGFDNSAIIVGSMNVDADVRDKISGVEKAEFYVDNALKQTVSKAPYIWTWNEVAVGPYTLKVVAYDNAGNKVSTEVPFIIFNLQY